MILKGMGVISMDKIEKEMEENIKALTRKKNQTLSWRTTQALKERIKQAKDDLIAYRVSMYSKSKYVDHSGVEPEDLEKIKKLYVREGLGFEELEQYFGGKYRYSQIRTAILEWLKYGN